jgi:hypothetical protein
MNTRRIVQSLLFVAILLGLSAASFGGVFLSVNIGPPPLPVYEQPPIPGAGYIWTPGYWGWGDEGYYWVPGTWVQPPEVGLLWTPGYWGWNNGAYMFNAGYWGPHVGFYGGINYGFGYTGFGYEGGYWRGRDFYYNRSVNNIRVTNIRNVYNRTVVVNNRTRVSYNGGNGGVRYRESARERQWSQERHIDPTPNQRQHIEEASRNRELLARNNGGRPPIAATERPNDFSHHVAARAAGGRVDRAALNATPKNMPARNENNNRAENARTANRTNNTSRTANRNESPRPSNASRTENGVRNNDRTRETAPATARSERNVPKPANASDRDNTRTENAHNVPKPSANTPARTHENANAHVAAPHANASAHENANAHVATPRENNHPATAATRPEPSERSTRSMGMPQGEHAPRSAAPAPRPESHAAPRPAEHNDPQPHAQANTHTAPQHEASRPAKSDKPKDEKNH